ncbi:MAG: hypothetical protein K6U80_19395 [Firmicutes bacterium]|nr:hypothetical protein [Bacillota bacterium]
MANAFAVELALLTKTELNKLDLEPINLPDEELNNWIKSQENSVLIGNLINKLKKLQLSNRKAKKTIYLPKNKKEIKAILKFLDEDYFTGVLTGRN